MRSLLFVSIDIRWLTSLKQERPDLEDMSMKFRLMERDKRVPKHDVDQNVIGWPKHQFYVFKAKRLQKEDGHWF